MAEFDGKLSLLSTKFFFFFLKNIYVHIILRYFSIKRPVSYAFLYVVDVSGQVRRNYWAIYKYRKYFRKEQLGGVLTTRAVWASQAYV